MKGEKMRDGKLEPKQEDGSDPIFFFFFSHIKKNCFLNTVDNFILYKGEEWTSLPSYTLSF